MRNDICSNTQRPEDHANLRAQLEIARTEKKLQKQEIQQWLDAFTLANGHKPSRSEKEVVRPAYSRYKQLEAQVEHLEFQCAEAEEPKFQSEASPQENPQAHYHALQRELEAKQQQKRAQKRKLQNWLQTFRQQYGREANKADKHPIRNWFAEYRDLEAECEAIVDELDQLHAVKKELELQEGYVDDSPDEIFLQNTRGVSTQGGLVTDKTAALAQHSSAADAPGSRIADLQERFQKLAEQQQELNKVEHEIFSAREASRQQPILSGRDSLQNRVDAAAQPDTMGGSTFGRTSLRTGQAETWEADNDQTRSMPNGPYAKEVMRDEVILSREAPVAKPPSGGFRDHVVDMTRHVMTEEIPDYLGLFEEEALEQEVVIAKITIEELEKKEQQLEEARLKDAEDEATNFRRREVDLAWREHGARNRLAQLESDTQGHLLEARKRVAEESLAGERALQRQFVAAKEKLEKLIFRQRAHFTEKYGPLITTSLAMARRFVVHWDFEPQPLEMRIHMMRAAKDKLLPGQYCFLLTAYERLGGHPITWRKLGFRGMRKDRPPATKPVKHKGRFFDATLRIDQSVFALCPSREQVRPSNCLILEAFYLAGRNNTKDEIVGWGVLPMCNPRFRMLQGRFKIPLLKGEPTPLIDKYHQISDLYSSSLTSWLCNLYVDVRHLSKEYMDKSGQLYREYDIEYDYIHQRLQLDRPNSESAVPHTQAGTGADHGEQDVLLAAEDGRFASHVTFPESDVTSHRPIDDPLTTWFNRRNLLFRRVDTPRQSPWRPSTVQSLSQLATDSPRSVRGSRQGMRGNSLSPSNKAGIDLPSKDPLAGQLQQQVGDHNHDDDWQEARSSGYEWWLGTEETRHVLNDKEATGRTEGEARMRRQRRRRQEGTRWDAQGLAVESVSKPSEQRELASKHGSPGKVDCTTESARDDKSEWFKLSDPQEMEYYSMAVAEDPTMMEQPLAQEIMRSKLLYLKTELLADLGIHNYRDSEFWITLTIYLTSLWMRMYVHFLGQYLYLKSRGQPVYNFEAALYCMRMKYISTTGEAIKELIVVMIGPFANICVFCVMFLAGWCMVRYIGQIPDSTSKAIAAFGIATLLDPILIFVVDILAGNFNCSHHRGCEVNYTASTCRCFVGDAFKLYDRFQIDENNGLTGACITIIIYIAEFLLTGFLLYNYLLSVHMNGRMLDVFRRLHGTSEDFFCPHDFEMTYNEIAYICEKAKKWTHPKGTRRRIAVCNYELTDPLEAGFVKEVTTHLAIYNLEMDGAKTLFRHFLRLPDGTIIELLDVMAKGLRSQYDSLEKLLLSDQRMRSKGGHFFAEFLK